MRLNTNIARITCGTKYFCKVTGEIFSSLTSFPTNKKNCIELMTFDQWRKEHNCAFSLHTLALFQPINFNFWFPRENSSLVGFIFTLFGSFHDQNSCLWTNGDQSSGPIQTTWTFMLRWTKKQVDKLSLVHIWRLKHSFTLLQYF